MISSNTIKIMVSKVWIGPDRSVWGPALFPLTLPSSPSFTLSLSLPPSHFPLPGPLSSTSLAPSFACSVSHHEVKDGNDRRQGEGKCDGREKAGV